MKQSLFSVVSIFTFVSMLVAGCKTLGYSHALKNENNGIEVNENPQAINYASLSPQKIPSFTDRASQSRGMFAPLIGSAVSLATNAIKKMIAKDRAKYTASYRFALTDLYFYDQLSVRSVFDPIGMQFSGFNLVRTFTNSQQQTDTAFAARFELDMSSPNEIINNSIFRLRLSELQLNYSKVKMTKAQKNSINMDIEITFNTSYVNEMGQLFDNVVLGKFYLCLRGAPMDKNEPGYTAYYEKLKDMRVDGRSFIVPRSLGYYKNENDSINRSYSQGAYSISVKVTESAKDRFITKVLSDNSSQIIDMLGSGARKALQR